MNQIVTLQSDRLKVEIWTLGARLNGVWFDGIGNLVDGCADEEEARTTKKFNGAVVGPVANRIAGGRASIDGTEYEFEKNENGITTLHSGSTGVHAQTWDILRHTDERLVMRLELPDGMGGFPGNRHLQADYALGPTGIRLTLSAKTDALTWVNLAPHPYWRLSENGREGMRMSVLAEKYTPIDAQKIPTGQITKVDGTIFDLGKLGVPSSDIDHNFCLSDPQEKSDHHVQVTGDLGVGMGIYCSTPGIQVFTGKEIGIAIEPQHFPDAMHHPRFPAIELRPGDEYREFSTYQFSRL